jgi:hypothetical protein
MRVVQPDQCCHKCKNPAPSWQALEFDHLDGRLWEMNRVGSDQRIRVMEREHKAGVRLAGACRPCNGADNQQKYTYSEAKWNRKARRVSRRDQDVQGWRDSALRDQRNRWDLAAQLYSEVRELLDSSA